MKRPGSKTASYWRTKEEVEAEYGAWHEEPRYNPESDDYDAAAYETLVKEIVNKAGLTQPEIGLGWRDLTVQVDVASGAPVETVGTQALGVWKGVYQSLLGLMRWRRAARLPPEERYHTILSKVSGYARPGEMVLVLAPPGGGASTLLKMLALRHQGFASSSGQVLYNGEVIPASHAVAYKHTLRVIGQDDDHFPQLSVRDTLSYAAEFKLPDFYPYAPVLRRHRVLQVARTLGISNTLDTPVGDAILRGVSGGEKKRVTVGEMAVAGVAGSLVLMDNWSRGLDSATTLDITKAIRGFAQRSRAVVVSSMQQPPEEVFDQFDRVCYPRCVTSCTVAVLLVVRWRWCHRSSFVFYAPFLSRRHHLVVVAIVVLAAVLPLRVFWVFYVVPDVLCRSACVCFIPSSSCSCVCWTRAAVCTMGRHMMRLTTSSRSALRGHLPAPSPS